METRTRAAGIRETIAIHRLFHLLPLQMSYPIWQKMPEWMVNAVLELNYIVRQGRTNNYSGDYKKLAGKEYTSAKDFFEKNKSSF